MTEKLWSHAAAQSLAKPGADPEVQEALSRRYGSGVIKILPLQSGRLAIFGADFQLIAFSAEAPSLDQLRSLSREMQERSRPAESSVRSAKSIDEIM